MTVTGTKAAWALAAVAALGLSGGVDGAQAQSGAQNVRATTTPFSVALESRRRGMDVAIVCAKGDAAIRAEAAEDAVLKRRLPPNTLVFLDTRRVSNGWYWALGAERLGDAGSPSTNREALPGQGWVQPDALCDFTQ